MAKQRRNARKWWLILLLVLPLGLLAGLLIGRAVDPDMLFRGERISSGGEAATRRADAAVERRNNELLDQEEPPGSFRPDFDYDEEVWPEDYATGGRNEGGEYHFYSAEDPFSDEALFEDDYRAGLDQETESRARESAPASNPEDPSARYAPLRERDPRPTPAENRQPAEPRPSEPRAADGDLPAIW